MSRLKRWFVDHISWEIFKYLLGVLGLFAWVLGPRKAVLNQTPKPEHPNTDAPPIEVKAASAQPNSAPVQASDAEKAQREEEKKLFRILGKYGFLIFPVVAYYLAYVYEAGFCSVWDIPGSFIQIDLSTVVIGASSLIGVGYVVTPIISLWHDRHKVPKAGYRRLLWLYSPFLAYALFVGETNEWKWNSLIVPAFIIVLFVLGDMMRAVNERLTNKSIPFTGAMKGALGYFDMGELMEIRSFLGAAFPVVAFVFIMHTIAGEIGGSTARNQKEFFTPLNSPHVLLIRRYGDEAIFAEIDDQHRYTHRIRVVKIEDLPGLIELKIGEVSFPTLESKEPATIAAPH